ncbi:putative DNA binding domain-containing protein [bacterium]|nr:putative DNA binding domain-containing protein [bacterium]
MKSKINPLITLEYIKTQPENKFFDVKSAAIDFKDLAKHISGFANADGGTIAIGVTDDRQLVGIKTVGEAKISKLTEVPNNYCKPMPQYQVEYLDITNHSGKNDRLLLIHIAASIDQVIYTNDERAYLRIGDETKEIKGENLKQLEYAKGSRHFEDELHPDAAIEDLDIDLLNRYCEIVGLSSKNYEQLLQSRGLLRRQKQGSMARKANHLTNAAVLLFARNITQFYPNCRVRFVRYDGNKAQVGTKMNIIKDVNIELPIIKLVEESKKFVSTQLREFTSLNPQTGKFETTKEYPEFAWTEGIVNAIVHREYGLSGAYVLVTMFDDRLVISSPGNLPNIVTLENIEYTRYSRNSRIARVMTEFGLVRELNEGVKRIFSDMQEFYLEKPVYSEPNNQYVELILKNNIEIRTLRQQESVKKKIDESKWRALDNIEKEILVYLINKGPSTRQDLVAYTQKTGRTITKKISALEKANLVQRNGNKHDPKQTYEFIYESD